MKNTNLESERYINILNKIDDIKDEIKDNIAKEQGIQSWLLLIIIFLVCGWQTLAIITTTIPVVLFIIKIIKK